MIKIQSPKTVIKNCLIFTLSGALMLAIVSIFWFFQYVTLSPELKRDLQSGNFSREGVYRISIVVVEKYIGENAHAERLQKAADQLGWQSYVFAYPLVMRAIPIVNWPIYIINVVLDYVLQPEFHLALTHHVNIVPPHPRYMFVNVPPGYVLYESGALKEAFRNLDEYDGYVDVNRFSVLSKYQDSSWIRKLARAKLGYDVSFVGLVDSVNANSYQECVPSKLMIFGSKGGAPRNSMRYNDLYRALDSSGLVEFYGPADAWNSLSGYGGFFTNGQEITEKLAKNCIGLAIHSDDHNYTGVPTGRIFETVSSGALAIVDQNPFIKRMFGESVLYFNQNQSPDQMAEQILGHITWARSHPQEVFDMTKRAHAVFLAHFTSEKFLLRVKSMDESRKKSSATH